MSKKLFNNLKKLVTVVLIFSFPVLTFGVIIITSILNMIWLIGSAFASMLPKYKPHKVSLSENEDKFISIQIAAYQEPPELLINTLRSLLRQTYKNFEIIVIDNNTKDKAIWQPVEKFCSNYKSKIKFFHVENLKGFKSGALNYIFDKTDIRTDYILVLDADYEMKPNALSSAVRYMVDDNIGLIQFPQAYKNVFYRNEGLSLDYKNFFLTYMNMANWLSCVPSTGTISFFNFKALKHVGKFSQTCITEDSEIGFRLNANGYRGIYVNEVIGVGLMPYDLEALKKQRYRWGFGNAQILKKNMKEILFNPKLEWKQRIGFLIQLTAWLNPNLFSMLTILFLGIYGIFFNLSNIQHITLVLASLNIGAYLIVRFITFTLALKKYKYSLKSLIKAYLSHVALNKIFMTAWFDCLIDSKYNFERTNKFILPKMPSKMKNLSLEIILAFTFLTLAISSLMQREFIQALGSISCFGIFFSILYLNRQMKDTKLMSAKIMRGLAIKYKNI